MTDGNMPTAGVKIGFIGKGGAGKSTCLILIARALARRGHDVCVLDTDSTNEGLHRALGIDQPPRPLIERFGGMVFQGGRVTCPADDPTLVDEATVDLNDLEPDYAVRSPDGIVYLSTGKLGDFGVGAGCDGPLVKIARDLQVHRGDQPVTMLIDLKAGLEDTSRGVIVGMDRAIVVCDPSAAGIGVARSMVRLFDDLRRGAEPATSHMEQPELAQLARELFKQSRLQNVDVLVNRASDLTMQAYVREALSAAGIEPITVLPDVPAIREAWLYGRALPSSQVSQALNRALDHLESGRGAAGAAQEQVTS
jgi:CO dehydrogenase nickel-insertion accessory protein CooC1